MIMTGKKIGNITISVFKFSEGSNCFYLQADNKDVLPVLDVIEDTLYEY